MSDESEDFVKTSTPDRLREIAELLRGVPVMFGTDEGDVDDLEAIATRVENLENFLDSVEEIVSAWGAGDAGDSEIVRLLNPARELRKE